MVRALWPGNKQLFYRGKKGTERLVKVDFADGNVYNYTGSKGKERLVHPGRAFEGGEGRRRRRRGEECVVCMSNRATQALIPCGHLCFCGTCATQHAPSKCPLCRADVESVVHIFSP